MENTTDSTPTLIDRSTLAARWHCCRGTLARLERRGLLKPVHLLDRKVKYRVADILKLEADDKVK